MNYSDDGEKELSVGLSSGEIVLGGSHPGEIIQGKLS